MSLKKRLKEIEHRLWLLENPRLFKDNEIVRYWPFLATTVESEADESYLVKVRYERGVLHEKVNGRHFWKRMYLADGVEGAIEVNERNLAKEPIKIKKH
jgi:hypothetical protein